jgi:hypothetical protein
MIETIRATILASDDLGHLFEATLMLLVLSPVLVVAWFRVSRAAFFLYPAFVAAWYHGREKAQHEIALKSELGLGSVIPLWADGWWPGEWSIDAVRDWAVPTLYALAWAVLLSAVFGRIFPRRRGPAVRT